MAVHEGDVVGGGRFEVVAHPAVGTFAAVAVVSGINQKRLAVDDQLQSELSHIVMAATARAHVEKDPRRLIIPTAARHRMARPRKDSR